jgi:hypothetical protein
MTDYSFNEFATIMINDKTLINDSNKIYNIKELFDGYIKFLMTKKYDNNVIKEYRAKTTIDYYIDFYCDNKKYDRNELIEQYKKNIIDNFDKILNPPKSFFTMARREYIENEKREQNEKENCDINTHYDTINKKYEYYNKLNSMEKQKQINYNDEYYNEHFENNINDEEYNSSNYYSDYDDYDYDYISENESEYYSDDY